MSFGKKILEKYGYKDGEGLGKQKNGIIEPIKANFKFDQSGLGDKGPVKEDHWWERVFNEASTNINVNKSEEGEIGIDLNDKEGVEITNKSFSLKKLKKSNTKLQYGNFLKSATLLANKGEEKEIEGHVTTNDIEIKPFQVLNDEELLKACEFRTAHKGARHGLNLSGKLKRIAEQEKALLEKMKLNRSEVFKQETLNIKKARKRPLLDLNSSKDDSSDENELPINLDNDKPKSKTKKKKAKKQINVLADQIESFALDKTLSIENISQNEQEAVVHVDTPIRKKRKDKYKHETEELNKIVEEIEQIDNSMHKKKKKKKKNAKKNINDDDEEMPNIEIKTPESPNNHVKIKRRKLDDGSSENSSSEEDIDKINEIHHINLLSNKIASVEPKAKNFENSIKKKKKKGKNKAALISDDNWKIQSQKKMEKYEHKKLKYKMKQEKLAKQDGVISKKSRKRQRKEEKKKIAELTDTVITEISSVEF